MTLNHFMREPIRVVCGKRGIAWMDVWRKASRIYPVGYDRNRIIDAIVAAMPK